MAGTLKPTQAVKEGNWIVNSAVAGYGNGITNLFDGTRGEWNNGNTFYWNSSSTYIDITIDYKSAIWILPNPSYLSYNDGLSVSVWNNQTNTFDFLFKTKNRTTANEWEKMIELEAGRYKFSYSSTYRMDDEWFIEKLVKNKILLLSNGETYSLEKGEIKTENAIPVMSSDTSPVGTIIYDTPYNPSSQPPHLAFDGIDQQGYLGNRYEGYLGFDFVKPTTIGKYAIRNGTTNSTQINAMPRDWTFEGSNDSVDWIVLDIQSGQSWNGSSSYTDREFVIQKPKTFKMYRLKWTANNSASYTNINELKMYELDSSKIAQLPSHSEQNFINYGMDSPAQVDGILSNKNYILQDTVSKDTDGLWKQELNRKPLSIKFE